MVSFVRLGPRSTPKEMALPSQLSEAVKAAAMETINTVVDFGDSIIERLSQLNYVMVLFVGLCGLTVVTIRSRRRLALLQKQLDKLEYGVRQLEFKESRRQMEVIHSRTLSESRTQQLDVPSITSPEDTADIRQSLGSQFSGG
jgi:hypothetical protein